MVLFVCCPHSSHTHVNFHALHIRWDWEACCNCCGRFYSPNQDLVALSCFVGTRTPRHFEATRTSKSPRQSFYTWGTFTLAKELLVEVNPIFTKFRPNFWGMDTINVDQGMWVLFGSFSIFSNFYPLHYTLELVLHLANLR